MPRMPEYANTDPCRPMHCGHAHTQSHTCLRISTHALACCPTPAHAHECPRRSTPAHAGPRTRHAPACSMMLSKFYANSSMPTHANCMSTHAHACSHVPTYGHAHPHMPKTCPTCPCMHRYAYACPHMSNVHTSPCRPTHQACACMPTQAHELQSMPTHAQAAHGCPCPLCPSMPTHAHACAISCECCLPSMRLPHASPNFCECCRSSLNLDPAEAYYYYDNYNKLANSHQVLGGRWLQHRIGGKFVCGIPCRAPNTHANACPRMHMYSRVCPRIYFHAPALRCMRSNVHTCPRIPAHARACPGIITTAHTSY